MKEYPETDIANFLFDGFSKGFFINYTGIRSPLQPRNMKSATLHKNELLDIIHKEIKLGRMSGLYTCRPISNLRCNPVGVLPKKDGGWRLITNLSAPVHNNVNINNVPSNMRRLTKRS